MTEYYNRLNDDDSKTPPPNVTSIPDPPPGVDLDSPRSGRSPYISKGLLISVPFAVLMAFGLRNGSHLLPLWVRGVAGLMVAGLGSPRIRGWIGSAIAMVIAVVFIALFVEIILVLTHSHIPWLGS
ncbi:hypothetical protein [Kitasatospora nipponensis]